MGLGKPNVPEERSMNRYMRTPDMYGSEVAPIWTDFGEKVRPEKLQYGQMGVWTLETKTSGPGFGRIFSYSVLRSDHARFGYLVGFVPTY